MSEPAIALPERTKEDHCTPEWLLGIIYSFAPIGLDPCSNPWSKVRASRTYSRHNGEDGLVESWDPLTSRWIIYVNPPYGAGKIMPWVEKAGAEYFEGGVQVLMLLPATPDTKWFREAFYGSRGVCFLRKRVAFDGAYPAGAKQPSALFYWGADTEKFQAVFSGHGIVIVKQMRQEVLVA